MEFWCLRIILGEIPIHKRKRLIRQAFLISIKQGWPTQISLWAATWKFCQKYRLFGPHDNKNLKKYTQNIEKSLILDSSFGHGLATSAKKLPTSLLPKTSPKIYFQSIVLVISIIPTWGSFHFLFTSLFDFSNNSNAWLGF